MAEKKGKKMMWDGRFDCGMAQSMIDLSFSLDFDKELLSESRARCEVTDEMLSLIDVLVDGEFKKELLDEKLHWKGSANQRVIEVPETLKVGRIVLFDD